MKLEWNHPIIKHEIGGDDMDQWELADFERAAQNMTVAPWDWLCALQRRPWFRVFNIYDLTRIGRRYARPDKKPWEITAMQPGRRRDELCAQLMRRYRTSIREILTDYTHWGRVQRVGWQDMGWLDEEEEQEDYRAGGESNAFAFFGDVLDGVVKMVLVVVLLLALLIARLTLGADGERDFFEWKFSVKTIWGKICEQWNSVHLEVKAFLAFAVVFVSFIAVYFHIEAREQERKLVEQQKIERAERRAAAKRAKAEKRRKAKQKTKQEAEAAAAKEAEAAAPKQESETWVEVGETARTTCPMPLFENLSDAKEFMRLAAKKNTAVLEAYYNAKFREGVACWVTPHWRFEVIERTFLYARVKINENALWWVSAEMIERAD